MRLVCVARRLALAALLLVGLASCQPPASHAPASRAAPITHGTLDEGDLGVVGLVDGGAIYCTGTMVSERVAVTAGHCVGGSGPDAVVFGASIVGGQQTAVIAARTPASFEMLDLVNDVGAVLLAEPAPEQAEIWPLLPSAFDDTFPGKSIRIVGFGQTENAEDPAGIKRQGQSVIESFTETTFRFTPNPSQTCLGDSGGPAFLTEDSVEYLVGVTSSGDPACVEFAKDTRIDAFAEDFLLPYIAVTAEGAADPGERCYYPENCAVGDCLQPVETPAFSYCSPACSDSNECPDGMECVADASLGLVCRYAGPEPGAAGAECADVFDCATDLCAASEVGGDRLCTYRCFPENEAACPSGYECLADPEQSTRFACYEPAAGCSCNAASRQRSGPLAPAQILLVGLLLTALRRRGRRLATAGDRTGR